MIIRFLSRAISLCRCAAFFDFMLSCAYFLHARFLHTMIRAHDFRCHFVATMPFDYDTIADWLFADDLRYFRCRRLLFAFADADFHAFDALPFHATPGVFFFAPMALFDAADAFRCRYAITMPLAFLASMICILFCHFLYFRYAIDAA